MNTYRTLVGLALLCLSGLAHSAPQSFRGLTCEMDIEKALPGREMPNEKVASIEARHTNLGLKDLGGYEVSDKIFLTIWRICGNQYVLLERGTQVKAVLKIPEQFKGSDEAIICSPVGEGATGTIVAVPSSLRTQTTIRAQAAWRVDEKKISFVPVTAKPLDCQREPGM
jgi:hypothetical protein